MFRWDYRLGCVPAKAFLSYAVISNMAKKVTGAIYARLFENVFICRRCKHKQRANPLKVRLGKIVCRNCGNRAFRIKSKMGKR